MATKRKDKSRVVLKTVEVQRKDGTYQFSWQDSQMKRRFVYARTLDDLREKEKRIQKDKCDGIKTEFRNVGLCPALFFSGSFESCPEAVKVKPSFILVHSHITLYHCTFRVEL